MVTPRARVIPSCFCSPRGVTRSAGSADVASKKPVAARWLVPPMPPVGLGADFQGGFGLLARLYLLTASDVVAPRPSFSFGARFGPIKRNNGGSAGIILHVYRSHLPTAVTTVRHGSPRRARGPWFDTERRKLSTCRPVYFHATKNSFESCSIGTAVYSFRYSIYVCVCVGKGGGGGKR